MQHWILSLFILTLSATLSRAASNLSESFSDREKWDSQSTAIWNQELGALHPSLQVVDYKIGYTTPLDFSVGDGAHGVFDVNTYASFSRDGDISGNVVRLDLSRFPILKVTRFHLAPTWSLQPVGDSPLIIHSLGSVIIEGPVWCHGDNGNSATGAQAGVGGQGRCGGGKGGNGGAPGTHGEDGFPLSGSVTGGKGGHHTGGAAVGGGGGGSSNSASPPVSGSNWTISDGGAAGNYVNDPEFNSNSGGGGGGGGSGTATEAGAGGGGGGGTVIIHAVGDVELGSNGFIYAYGGNGGNSNVGGGPGGGGAGGSVKIFSGSTFRITDNVVASQALNGLGGNNSLFAGGANGGEGRSWVASIGYFATGSYLPSEDLAVLTPNTNTVAYSTAPEIVITKSYDLGTSLARIQSIDVSPASTDFSLEFNGSRDDFQNDESGWTTDLTQLNSRRFVKFKITITNSAAFSPTLLQSVSLHLDPGIRQEFEFKTSGCGMLSSPPSSSEAAIWLLLSIVFTPLILAMVLRLSLTSRAI